MAQLVMSLVITGIDYCNSVLAGLPACTLVLMQRVQNVAARLVLNLDRRSHIIIIIIIIIIIAEVRCVNPTHSGHTSVLHYNSCTGCR